MGSIRGAWRAALPRRPRACRGSCETDAWREELAHDALNALAALRASVTLLERYDGALDAPVAARLRAAALGEIGHLERLVVRGDRAQAAVDFDVAGVIADVVETQRATGLMVVLDVPPLRAHGRPGDVATALRNLLVNAGEHGGGRVTVRCVDLPSGVEVIVSDHGPGIPDAQVLTLFQRGARGPASRGSGLGLHVSRALMRQVGGDLQLRRHRRGATFAMVLPAASPAQALWPRTDGRVAVATAEGR